MAIREMPSDRDELFVHEGPGVGEFRFDDAVAQVLPDMLRRSIPGYATLLDLIGILARQRVAHGTNVYDLGCSLGAVTLSVRHALGARDARLVAVDLSPAMVERCRAVVDADGGQAPVEVLEADVAEVPLERASFVVFNFTLQFVPEERRLPLLERVRRALVPGGLVVVSEKIRAESEADEEWYRSLHDAFRQSNGYSLLELHRKREALERVLVPDSEAEHLARFAAAGFTARPLFRGLQFVSWALEVRDPA